MVKFQNSAKLKDFLFESIKSQNLQIISIDGMDGSGKSTLASYLAKHLNMYHMALDEDKYLITQKGTYVNFIRYDILETDLSEFRDKNQRIIIDGICILEILDNINIKPDLKIYVKNVKRLAASFHWFDGEIFDYSRDVEEVLKEKEDNLKVFIDMEAMMEGREPQTFESKESIFHEIMRYHFKYKPDLNADIIFERTEETS